MPAAVRRVCVCVRGDTSFSLLLSHTRPPLSLSLSLSLARYRRPHPAETALRIVIAREICGACGTSHASALPSALLSVECETSRDAGMWMADAGVSSSSSFTSSVTTSVATAFKQLSPQLQLTWADVDGYRVRVPDVEVVFPVDTTLPGP